MPNDNEIWIPVAGWKEKLEKAAKSKKRVNTKSPSFTSVPIIRTRYPQLELFKRAIKVELSRSK